MRKKDLKKWLNNLKRRGIPMTYNKGRTEPWPKKDAEHLAHMRRNVN